MRLCLSYDMIMMSMKDSAGQMPELGATVIIVIPLRLGVSVNNRWITVIRSVRSKLRSNSLHAALFFPNFGNAQPLYFYYKIK
jgi:hypothetical protein